MRVYVDFLARFLPVPPDRVEVHTFEDEDTAIVAFAVRPNRLFFRSLPPDPRVLVHELIHLCEKPASLDEEVYAWDLTELVIHMAENGVRGNPFLLFELKIEDVTSVLRKHGINSVDDYYSLVGIIPPYASSTAPPPEDLVVATFVIDLITPPWDALRYAILLDLLELVKE
ncbi:MAG: hypothetical protein QXG48_03880 [Thermofilaceae archaeon]